MTALVFVAGFTLGVLWMLGVAALAAYEAR